jgi:hypothetical protein
MVDEQVGFKLTAPVGGADNDVIVISNIELKTRIDAATSELRARITELERKLAGKNPVLVDPQEERHSMGILERNSPSVRLIVCLK